MTGGRDAGKKIAQSKNTIDSGHRSKYIRHTSESWDTLSTYLSLCLGLGLLEGLSPPGGRARRPMVEGLQQKRSGEEFDTHGGGQIFVLGHTKRQIFQMTSRNFFLRGELTIDVKFSAIRRFSRSQEVLKLVAKPFQKPLQTRTAGNKLSILFLYDY